MSDHREKINGGWIRLIVRKIEKPKFGDGFEIQESDFFSTHLANDEGFRFLEQHVGDYGFDLFTESVEEILSPYRIDDVVEIVGEGIFEFWKSWTDMGYEHDAAAWLDNEKHRKMPDALLLELSKEPGPKESA